MMHPEPMRTLTILALATLPGCIRFSAPVPIESGTNFAAHATAHNEIALDRLPDGSAGMVEAASWFNFLQTPTFLVNANHQTVAILSLTAPATVQVRADRSSGAPVVGSVEPSWEDNAIRLALHSADAAVFQSDVFARTVTGGGTSALTRSAPTILDVRGIYRGALRDANGTEAGWIRVRISPYSEAPRIYDGVLPAGASPGLAAAVAVALNSEIDWIENHTVNVYRGADGGPLRESVPMGR